MLVNMGTALVAFGIFSMALENFGLAVICFGVAAWCVL
jgi:hypothetical protein